MNARWGGRCPSPPRPKRMRILERIEPIGTVAGLNPFQKTQSFGGAVGRTSLRGHGCLRVIVLDVTYGPSAISKLRNFDTVRFRS